MIDDYLWNPMNKLRYPPKPTISVNKAFRTWARHQPLPPKWICTADGVSGTGNLPKDAYRAWEQSWGMADRERGIQAKCRYVQNQIAAPRNVAMNDMSAMWNRMNQQSYGLSNLGGTWI